MVIPLAQDITRFGSDTIWTIIVCGFLAIMVLSGGYQDPATQPPILQSAAALVILAASFWRLRNGFPSKLATAATALVALGVLLLALQIIPLPTSMWQALPGREPVRLVQDIIGVSAPAMTLSLDPAATAAMVLYLLAPLALFFAVMTLAPGHFKWLFVTLIAVAIISLILGVIQYASGPGSSWYLYGYDDRLGRNVTGTFRSPTFFAAQLFVVIPVFMALGVSLYTRMRMHFIVTAVFMLVYMGAIVVGISLSSSRSGIVLAMLAVLLSSVMWSLARDNEGSQRRFSGAGLLFAVAAFFVMSQVSMFGILRLADTDPLSDYRGTMAVVSWRTFLTYFPAGSGFGTFVPAYLIHETPADLRDNYANHAHNDWLEFMIEGGAPGVLLLLAFFIWVCAAFYSVWRMDRSGGVKVYLSAASICILLYMLHGVVDYTLRMPAHAVSFAVFAALLTRHTSAAAELQRTYRNVAPQKAATSRPIQAGPRMPGGKSGSFSRNTGVK